MNFASLTIKKKLYFSYGLLALTTLALGVSAMVILHNLAGVTNDLGVKMAKRLSVAGVANSDTAEFLSYTRGIVVAVVEEDGSLLDRDVSGYREYEADLRARINEMKSLGLSSKSLALADELLGELNEMDGPFEHLVQQAKSGDIKGMTASLDHMRPTLSKIDQQGTDLCNLERDVMAEHNAEGQASVTHANWLLTVLLILGGIVGVALLFIIRGLDAQLRNVVTELSEGANQVSQAATEVSSSSQSLSRESSEQAAMIEETSASAEEVNSMARRNVENARNATDLVSEAVRSTEQTNIAVSESVEAMNSIGESSSQIAKTLQVIDKIAFQTNILALNAAVEAARAGEAGMGFAVVAEEVRNLAQRCAAASQEISGLIEASLSNSDMGRAKITSLVEAGERVNVVFSKMRTLVDEICTSSEEQGRGIDQIRSAIQRMEQGTQKSAANAEESAAAAEELTAQADALNSVARTLGALVGTIQTSGNLSLSSSSRTSSRPHRAPITMIRPATPAPRLTPAAAAAAFPLDDDSNFKEF